MPSTQMAWHLASVFDIKSRFLSGFISYTTKNLSKNNKNATERLFGALVASEEVQLCILNSIPND